MNFSGWPFIPTGEVLTLKNNNPYKNTDNNIDNSNTDFNTDSNNPDPNNLNFNPDSNNPNPNNPDFNPDSNNPDNSCKLRLFLTRPALDRFHDSSKVNALCYILEQC